MMRRVNKEEEGKKQNIWSLEADNRHLQTQLTDVSGTGTPQLHTQAGTKTHQVYCCNNCM